MSRYTTWSFDSVLIRYAVLMTIWCTAVLYACWRFAYTTSNLPLQVAGGFTDSMHGLTRKRDITHVEWNRVSKGLLSISAWFLLQPLLTQFFIRTFRKVPPCFYAMYTTTFLMLEYDLNILLLQYAIYALMYLATTSKHRGVCYILFAVLYLGYKMDLTPSILTHIMYRRGADKGVLIDVGTCYAFLRSLSFALDCIERDTVPPLWKTLAYYLYLPNFFWGPLMNYSDFEQELDRPPTPWSFSKRSFGLFLNLVRCYVLYLFYNLHTHYFYHQVLSYHPHIVETLDAWSAAGFCFLSSFSIFLEYRIFLLLGESVAALDGLRLHPAPMCIARLYSMAHLWKYFNRGFHLWAARYFYIPFVGRDKPNGLKVIGAGLCFGIIWFGHNGGAAISAWCSINCLTVLLEKFVIHFGTTCYGVSIQDRFPNLVRQLQLILYTTSFLLVYMSNMFLATGWRVPFIVFNKLICAPLPMVALFMATYCGICCSLEFQKKMTKRNRKCEHIR
ncbi:protein-cysteine N-palmitoyltransferase Rasp-like isoform X1 [Ornithodoros turicata]|uniref:protein-cysteine N-palmitoyltransferase Rasp-like isoform X1 n=1 Tax=Ornithodoros turicata TaxID=34597 RepID=UPI003138BF16